VASAEDESGDKLVSVQLDDEESWLNFIDVPGSEVCVPLNQGRIRDLLAGSMLVTNMRPGARTSIGASGHACILLREDKTSGQSNLTKGRMAASRMTV